MPIRNSIEFRRRLTPLIREFQHCQKLVAEEKSNLSKEQEELSSVEEAQSIVQVAAEDVQNLVHSHLASIVSKALKSVYLNKAYEFQIRFDKKRQKTEANMVFCRDGHELTKPEEEAGVGQIEIAALALRLACLLLIRPKRRLLLVLDEPFRAVHGKENRRRAAELLQSLSKEFEIQMVIATGLNWLRIGKIVEIS